MNLYKVVSESGSQKPSYLPHPYFYIYDNRNGDSIYIVVGETYKKYKRRKPWKIIEQLDVNPCSTVLGTCRISRNSKIFFGMLSDPSLCNVFKWLVHEFIQDSK